MSQLHRAMRDPSDSNRRLQMRWGGIVLCGGQSRRMGRSKASLLFGEETSLQRVVRVLDSVVSPVVVVGSKDLERPQLPDHVIFVRDSKAFEGPLSGLINGMQILHNQVEAAFLIGCDMPLLQPDFVRFVIAQLSQKADIVAAKTGDKRQPFAAGYRLSLLDRARALLGQGERSLQSLLKVSRVRQMESLELRSIDADLDSLKNMNTLEDYEELLRRFRGAVGREGNAPVEPD